MFDSTKAGLHRLYEQGVTKYDALAAIPADKLQVAIEQLPEVSRVLSCPVWLSMVCCELLSVLSAFVHE